MLYVVFFNLIKDLYGVAKRLRPIGKHLVHLRLSFHPLLLGIKHSVRVVQISTRRQTNQMVVCLGIIFVNKMHIVRAHQFHAQFFRQFNQHLIYILLQWIGFKIGALSRVCLMPLQLKIIVIAKHAFKPSDYILCVVNTVCHNQLWHFATKACRTHNQIFVIFFEVSFVDTRVTIETFGPCQAHNFYEVLIPVKIFCKHHQVIATVGAVARVVHIAFCHIHLATENWLEQSFLCSFKRLV